MGELVQLSTKPLRNLYIVDNYHVILAHSAEEALSFVQYEEDADKVIEVMLVDDQKEVYVIKSGKVEIILWEREPKPLEQLSFVLKVRDFIDRDLKRFSTPSFQDSLEDKGAIRPKN